MNLSKTNVASNVLNTLSDMRDAYAKSLESVKSAVFSNLSDVKDIIDDIAASRSAISKTLLCNEAKKLVSSTCNFIESSIKEIFDVMHKMYNAANPVHQKIEVHQVLKECNLPDLELVDDDKKSCTTLAGYSAIDNSFTPMHVDDVCDRAIAGENACLDDSDISEHDIDVIPLSQDFQRVMQTDNNISSHIENLDAVVKTDAASKKSCKNKKQRKVR